MRDKSGTISAVTFKWNLNTWQRDLLSVMEPISRKTGAPNFMSVSQKMAIRSLNMNDTPRKPVCLASFCNKSLGPSPYRLSHIYVRISYRFDPVFTPASCPPPHQRGIHVVARLLFSHNSMYHVISPSSSFLEKLLPSKYEKLEGLEAVGILFCLASAERSGR
jgi:hypothetical protein